MVQGWEFFMNSVCLRAELPTSICLALLAEIRGGWWIQYLTHTQIPWAVGARDCREGWRSSVGGGGREGQLLLTMSPLIPSAQPLLNPSFSSFSAYLPSLLSHYSLLFVFSSCSLSPSFQSPFHVFNVLWIQTLQMILDSFSVFFFFNGYISPLPSLLSPVYYFVPSLFACYHPTSSFLFR